MYKLLFFLHKSDDENVLKHFEEVTVNHLKEITGNDIMVARVESNFLLETKYSYFCEVSATSIDEMNKLMNTKAGKELNNDLMLFHNSITVISVNYSKDA